jgi:lantibiotic transport system permease protein
MNLIVSLRSEMLKTKRTASFYFTLIGAAPIPAILLLNLVLGGADLDATRKDPINAIFDLGMERNGLVFFPVFVILVCTLLPQVEYRNNTWKQVLASPQTKTSLFFAKFININLLMMLFLMANIVFMMMVIVVIHFAYPTLDLLSRSFDATRLLTRTATVYVTMLAVCALQFWLGLRFRNFIIPIAVGLALWFTGMMMSFEFKSSLVDWFPYSLQTFPFMSGLEPKLTQVAWTSAGYAAIFLLGGFLDFRSRRLAA